MDWKQYKEFLLSNIERAKPVKGGREINCRCRECSDSENPKSMHMYISIPNNSSEPSLYYCHKCGAKGIVTHNKLLSWGLYDQNIANDLLTYNREISNNPRNNKYFDRYTYQIRHTYTNIDSKSEEKRIYICNRLGKELTFDNLRDLKICVNLLDLLKENNIRKLSRDINIVNDLDREFIGFISIDNAYMNMRRTCEEGKVYKTVDKRYVNYQIFDKFSTEERFYTIPTRVDMNGRDRIKLHIAEGPFDILSIYLNLRNREEGIYTSITGNNPVSILMYFLSICMLPYIEIHYYVDNDKFGRDSRIRYLVNQLPNRENRPIFIHRNGYEGEKDFGVSVNRIKEVIYPLR